MRVSIETLKENSSLTVSELLEKLEAESKLAEQAENEEFEKVKSDFTNVYLKRTTNDGFFGKALEIYSIEEIIDRERTTDWEFIYEPKGNSISFSKSFINFRDLEKMRLRFSEKSLREMEVITKREYESYLGKYEYIKTVLNKLIE